MGKYSINYSCGHDGEEQLYGKISERERYVEWAEGSKLCPECYRAKLAAEREAESREASEANAAAGLPALIGSPKQIAWAESIRAKALSASGNQICADPEMRIAAQPADKQGICRIVLAAMQAARTELERQASAKWWIEHRAEIYPLEMYVREAGVTAQKQAQEVAR